MVKSRHSQATVEMVYIGLEPIELYMLLQVVSINPSYSDYSMHAIFYFSHRLI